MAVDFNAPTDSTTYSSTLGQLRENIIAAGKLLHTSGSNIASGTLRYNRTSKQFEEYNGSTWDAKELTNLADDAVSTAKVAANAVTGAKMRLDNTQYLRGKLAGGSDHNILRIASDDYVEINQASGKGIRIGTSEWVTNRYQPGTDNNCFIGSSTKRWAEIWSVEFLGPQFWNQAGTVRLGTGAAYDILFAYAGTNEFKIDGSGFSPLADNTYRIANSSNRLSELYTKTIKKVDSINCDNAAMVIGTTGAYDLQFSPNGSLSWSMTSSGHLVPTGSRDIGSASVNVGNVHANTLKSAIAATFGSSGAYAAEIMTNNTVRLSISSAGIPTWSNQNVTTGGAGEKYWNLTVNGVAYKILLNT